MRSTDQITDLTTLQLRCPSCKKNVLWNDDFPHRPFCSDRCRLIDLGEWASENHRIAGDDLTINTEEEY
uniref:DNA gyrase inhibitor YacG n=1 Tax=Cellvibrio fontiphilus TaxID=1815559 RepID=UPI002B4BCDAE|nr:DNA gyrase inhibitor YacG [Cellvibrio fontiphilus]